MFPNEDDMTVLVAAFHRAHLAAVRADPESAYRRLLSGLPEGPDLAGAGGRRPGLDGPGQHELIRSAPLVYLQSPEKPSAAEPS